MISIRSKIAIIMMFLVVLGGCGSSTTDESSESSESSDSSESSVAQDAETDSVEAFASADTEEDGFVINVKASKLSNSAMVQEKTYIGLIEPEKMVYVSATSSDTVTAVHKEVGEVVYAGERLFELDSEDQQTALTEAELNIISTEAETGEMLGSLKDDILYEADRILDATADDVDLMGDRIENLETKVFMAELSYSNASSAYRAASAALAEAEALLPDNPETAVTVEALKASVAAERIKLNQADELYDLANSNLDDAVEKEENYAQDLELTTELSEEIHDKTVNDRIDELDEIASQKTELAKLGHEKALKALNDTIYTSPINGVVYSVGVTENNHVNSGVPAFIIADTAKVVVNFAISQSEISEINIGDELLVEMDGEEYSGKIIEIPQTVNSQSNSFMAQAVIDNKNDVFAGGERVNVNLFAGNAEDTISVPMDSVYFEGETDYVYTVEDGKAVKKIVEVGAFNDKSIEVISGLTDNDVLITTWSEGLKAGTKVNIIE